VINTQSTADVIISMAEILERHAKELRRISKRMVDQEDITFASEALQTMLSCLNNVRLDLLVTRPIQAYEDEIERMKDVG